MNAFDLLKPSDGPTASSRGECEVHFRADKDWEESWQSRPPNVKPSVRVDYMYAYILTPGTSSRHADQLSGLGPGIRPRLTHFEFTLSDVSYTAHNANELTDDAAIRLARLFPSLRVVKLQGADHTRLTDATLIAFLSNCPHLTFIEVSGLKAAGAIHDSSFDALRRHPSWAPKLKTLRVSPCWESTRKDEDQWMKAMRALSKERQSLLVEIVRVSETKKRGDWELETYGERYRRGRIPSSRPSW
ncbi:hypothetical protein PLIIFM63780_009803 [Purpureocillium lilacinum]|uniref:Uncharacterized protein n=1 Tax=Purpureocillium lilacinum TaxID=33203 RepID=A0A179GIU3_PURLI|nr:hypothetical protein VFPBJ_08248 [Purpureocillium lilacinum]GJN86224.1 hypothetical protein PLIIFM63780_009803 [Purpureocillium lilacinum]